MLDILTIVHSYADIQTASRIRQICRRLSILTPEPTRYTVNDRVIEYEYRVCSKLHRLDGPSMVTSHGSKSWYRGGICHREYHPQYIGPGYMEYKVEGVYHREAGPSIVYSDRAAWYLRGNPHRKTGPAYNRVSGLWYTLGIRHRLDGPTYENIYEIRGVKHNIFGTTDDKWVIDGIVIRR